MSQSVRAVTVIDWDDRGQCGIDAIVDRIRAREGAPSVRREPAYNVPALPDGRARQCWVIAFDGNRVRDTWVHGWACDAGYVASITG